MLRNDWEGQGREGQSMSIAFVSRWTIMEDVSDWDAAVPEGATGFSQRATWVIESKNREINEMWGDDQSVAPLPLHRKTGPQSLMSTINIFLVTKMRQPDIGVETAYGEVKTAEALSLLPAVNLYALDVCKRRSPYNACISLSCSWKCSRTRFSFQSRGCMSDQALHKLTLLQPCIWRSQLRITDKDDCELTIYLFAISQQTAQSLSERDNKPADC